MIRGSICSSSDDLAWVPTLLDTSRDSPNQFEYWYSHIVELGIPTPKTVVIPLSPEVIKAVYREEPLPKLAELQEAVKLVKQVEQTFETWGADKLFLKNSLSSAKHWWKNTCDLPKLSPTRAQHHILSHIGCSLFLWIDSNFILPTAIILREMLDIDPAFHAFKGTPITKEFRLFVENGRVIGYQPYWPEDSIFEADADDWREKLQAISSISPELLLTITKYAEKITLPHDWSVDFLIDRDGNPWLIDMALSQESFKFSDEQGYVHCPLPPPINTDEEHQTALSQVSELLNATLSAPEQLKLDRLAAEVELFEKARFKITPPTAEEMAIFRANEQRQKPDKSE